MAHVRAVWEDGRIRLVAQPSEHRSLYLGVCGSRGAPFNGSTTRIPVYRGLNPKP